jgi:PIN domain nuclease of toxin-antitoxin system
MESAMMLLLDTCAFIWNTLQPEELSQNAVSAIAEADSAGGLHISDITFWELAMLMRKGRIQSPYSYQTVVELAINANPCTVVSINPAIAELSTLLPPSINSDPADRIIVATAIIANLSLITADRNLRDSPLVTTIW